MILEGWQGNGVLADADGNLYASAAARHEAVTLLATKTVTAAGTTNETAVAGLGGYRQIALALTVSGAADAAADTLDVYVDTSFDEGTTWFNVAHFTQFAGNTDVDPAVTKVLMLNSAADPGTDEIDTTTDCAAAKARPALFGDRLRVRHVVVKDAATVSFTFGVKAFCKA